MDKKQRRFVSLHEETYQELDTARDKRESFDEFIARLLDIRRMVLGAEVILHGQKAIEAFRRVRAEAKDATD